MRKLDNPQEKIYQYIQSFYAENGCSPTVREICSAVGLRSPSTVHTHLKNMREKGLLSKGGFKQRVILLSDQPNFRQPRSIPIVGHVAAGQPIFAIENVEDAFPLPNYLTRGGNDKEVFMLRVQGDSMIDAGILPNDLIVINCIVSCENGDIVVVRIDGEDATVKRMFREKDVVRLQPENDFYEPIYVPYERLDLIGKVVGLLRSF